ncbi:MAG: CPBP family intramembrane metalloprotease [Elusimicrobia bacterium]|nr:CPBP family intramembrane metalloprotease [Elusimicrobiota bacterium]
MNRIARFFSAFLSLSLVLAAPGLAPYQAAAQTLSAARIVVPAGQIGRLPTNFGSGASSPYGSVDASLGLQTGLIPALSPSAALMPVMSAPAAVVKAAPAALPAPSALKAAARPAAVTPEKLAATPASALSVLKTGSTALVATAKTASADAPRAALDALFEGSISRPEALAVSGRSAASGSPRLAPSAAREPAPGPRWVKTLLGSNDAPPATSVKRTLSVGFLAAVIPIAITMVTVVVAQLLGYQLHPNYVGPDAGAVPTILSALAMWVGAAVMAPISEEAIFRGGLQGRLAKLAAKLRLGSFVVPAVITSLVFVALHETADPVLFATRFVHAMILSYVYHKEGILASMAAHGFFNGLLAMSVVFSALGLPWLGLAAAPAALYFAMKAAKVVRAQKPDVDSGALAPKPLSARLALIMAAVLMLGYFFIMPNIFWPIGAVALLVNGLMKLKNKKA